MNATAKNLLTSLVVAVLLAGAAAVLAEDEITAEPAAELSAAIDPAAEEPSGGGGQDDLAKVESTSWHFRAKTVATDGRGAAITAEPAAELSAATDPAAEEPSGGGGQDDLAKQLANPLASLVSVPFQNNFDWGGGPEGDGFQWKMNVQPVIPFSLNDDWNLITRTILPVISQEDIAGTRENPSGSQTGLGDTLFSMWASPAEPTDGGWIWGLGSALLIPTGTDSDNFLGGNQWGLGPTAIALRSDGPITYGLLVNHLWNVGGTDGRPEVNSTYFQPFLSYIPGGGWTFNLTAENTYDWTADQFTIPINLSARKMFNIGDLNAQWELGGRYYAEKGDQGPSWGLRAGVTLLFPR